MTKNETTLELVQRICADMTGREPPAGDQQLYYDAKAMNDQQHIAAGGYGLDSLDGVELVMLIEDETGMEIADKVAESDQFKTPNGIARWLVDQMVEI